jgi:hypothetical protein
MFRQFVHLYGTVDHHQELRKYEQHEVVQALAVALLRSLGSVCKRKNGSNWWWCF